VGQNKFIGFWQAKKKKIGGFVMPAGPQDCSLAGEMSVVKQSSGNSLTRLSYANTRVLNPQKGTDQ
jgi:hypothetical protein